MSQFSLISQLTTVLDTVTPSFGKSLKVRLVADLYRYYNYTHLQCRKCSRDNGSGQKIILSVVTVTFVLIIIIVITAILVLSIHKLLPKCSKSRKLCY